MAKRRLDLTEIRRVARENFGYDQLRPGQEQVIEHLLAGHDTLSIMPTGSGKSAIYQIAALFIKGPTVVVSPLIALQKDQVDSLDEINVAKSAVINSTITAAQRRDAFGKLASGELEFLFLAPEQFANDETMQRLLESKPSLFVVDEAHCVTEWGHDFRPDYARLGSVIDALGHPRIIALTATASPTVQEEIVERLGMADAKVVVWGFDRPNIHLAVEKCDEDEIKQRVLIGRVQKLPRPGIVYVATRKHAEEIALLLRENNVAADAYHAGLKTAERTTIQETFMAEDDRVIVATNAFGMGVDKSNVRFVIHYDISDSLDAYYQEIGRAGRDGEPAQALLLYRSADVGRRRAQSASGKLELDQVEQLAETIARAGGPVDPAELTEQSDMSETKIAQTLNRLHDAGAVRFLPSGEVIAKKRVDQSAAAEQAVEQQENFRDQRMGRVEIMRDYAETGDCRRRYLLNYFGEKLPEPCGYCDNCEAGVVEQQQRVDATLPFAPKSRVVHRKYGEGIVMRYEQDKIVILFETAGEKELVTTFVVEKKLLKAV